MKADKKSICHQENAPLPSSFVLPDSQWVPWLCLRLLQNPFSTVNAHWDCRTWTFKDLEKFANEFVEKNYEGSSSQLQYRFIEREFWKEFLLRQNKYVRYASDVPGTAFDAWEELARSDWNLGVSSCALSVSGQGGHVIQVLSCSGRYRSLWEAT